MMRIGGEGGDNEAATDAEGRYEITGLAPGTWTVTASHPDWSEATTSVELKDAPATADIRLGRGGSIGGVGARRRPAGGRRPGHARRRGRQRHAPRHGLPGRRRAERPQRRGRALPLRPPRRPAATRSGASLRDQSSAPAEAVVTGDDAQEVQLTLAEGALVRGVVTGPARRAARGRQRQRPGPGTSSPPTRTSAGGSFELSGVPEGDADAARERGRLPDRLALGLRPRVTIGPGQAEATAEIASSRASASTGTSRAAAGRCRTRW